MTYSNPEIIATLLKNNGVYPGDPQMARVYSYQGSGTEALYAVFMDARHDDMHLSPYVRKAVLLWDKDTGLTPAGEKWLEDNS